MADKKISQLTALAAANLAPSTDVLAIVDTSATETKKIVAQDLINGVLNVASAVGIGTASPAATLQLKASSGNTGLYIQDASGSPNVSFLDSAGTVQWQLYSTMGGAAGLDPLNLYNSSAGVVATFSNSGNLGLGVTPSAWSAYKAYQVGWGALASTAATQNTLLSSNVYFDGTNFRYIGSSYASYLQQFDGAFIWKTAPSWNGTGSDVISFTQAMTLDASGNLLVGGTTAGNAGTVTINVGNVGSTAGGLQLWAGTAQTSYVQFGDESGTPANHYRGYMAYAHGNDSLQFGTASTERARITSGGYFKASNAGTYQGATGAYHELRTDAADYSTIVGNTNASPYGAYILFGSADPNNSTNLFLLCNGWNGSTLVTRATIRSNGGLANYQSNNVDLSDARTKKDITPAASMWDKIGALEIVTYKYNDQTHDDVNFGVIAQQVESVEPVWVDADGFGETPEGEEPLKTVYTKDITFAAIKALQEAMARIEQLEADMAALKASA